MGGWVGWWVGERAGRWVIERGRELVDDEMVAGLRVDGGKDGSISKCI